MNRRDTTVRIVDQALQICITAGSLGAGIVLPNLLVALEKPLEKSMKSYEKREKQREILRVIYYMKSQGYLSGDYEHGLLITRKGQKHLAKLDFERLAIARPTQWDHMWRLVFYDIPENHRDARQALTAKLRSLGFFQMQRSVWIHPFPSRDVVSKVTSTYDIAKYVSYIETSHIDNEEVLIKRFKKRLPGTKF